MFVDKQNTYQRTYYKKTLVHEGKFPEAFSSTYVHTLLKRCIVSGSDVLPAFLLVSHKYLNGMYYLKATKKTYLSFSLTNYCFIFVWGVLFYKAS